MYEHFLGKFSLTATNTPRQKVTPDFLIYEKLFVWFFQETHLNTMGTSTKMGENNARGQMWLKCAVSNYYLEDYV